MHQFFGLLGIAAILLVAFLLSSDKRAIRPRVVVASFALQAVIAYLVLNNSVGRAVIQGMATGVSNLLGYAGEGTAFLFGPKDNNPALYNTFALGALPVIIFFAALVSILYYLGIMQRVVRWVGGAIGWATGIGRVEALGSAANIFVGQSESPLVVRPYLAALAAGQAVHPDGGRHGGRRGHHPRGLRQPARRPLSAVPPRRRLHECAGRDPDGQAVDARSGRAGRFAHHRRSAGRSRAAGRDGADRRNL